MAVKEDALRKMDQEIVEFFRSFDTEADQEAVEKLQHYTLLRSELENIPLNPPQIDAMCQCDSLLKVADAYSSYVKTKGSPDYTELARFFIDKVYHNARYTLLLERMQHENEDYHDSLLSQPPKEIIDSAYEMAMKNDIVLSVENDSLSPPQIDALLTLEYPLDAIYHEWLDTDASYMEMLSDSMKNLIEDQIKILQQRDDGMIGETPSVDIQVWEAMYNNPAEYEDSEEEDEDEDLEP